MSCEVTSGQWGGVFGARLGVYRLLTVLGGGAHGVVHQAMDERTGRLSAVKLAHDQVASQTLLSELAVLRTLGRGQHPGIVEVFEWGELEGRLWFAMELIVGGSLSSFQRLLWFNRHEPRQPTTSRVAAGELTRVLKVIRSLATVLSYVQDLGIAHGDLSPENILFREGEQVVLADWGSVIRTQGTVSLPGRSRDLATPGFCAPERLSGCVWDSRADIYSLGCISYQLLTGLPPFSAVDSEGLYHQHLSVEPVPPSRLVRGVPPALDRLVLLTLEKDPTRRIARASEIVSQLDEIVGLPADRSPVIKTTFRSRLVARDKAIECVRDALGSSSRLVVVRGEPGSGKTRFLYDLPGALGAMRVATSFVDSPARSERPLQCFVDVVHDAIAAQNAKSEGGQAAPLSELCAYLTSSTWERGENTDQATRVAYFEALAYALEVVAGGQRTCWLLDDVDGTDFLTQDFLRWFAAGSGASLTAFVVATAIDAFLVPQSTVPCIQLASLTWQQTADMAGGVLAVPAVSSALVDYLFGATRGNPLGISELLQSIVNAGDVALSGHLAVLRESGKRFGPSISGLSGLGPTVVRAAQVAAVVGRRFDAKDVEGVLGAIDDQASRALWEAIEQLVERGIVLRQGPSTYIFKHETVRAQIEASLSPADAVRLHEIRARCLEAAASGPPLVQVGVHWANAGNAGKAIPYLRRAAKLLASRAAVDDAIELTQRALHLATDVWSSTDALTDRIRLELMRLYARAGRHHDVVVAARELGVERHASQMLLRVRIYRLASLSSRVISDYASAESNLRSAWGALERLDLRRVVVRREWLELKLCQAKLLYVQGRANESSQLLRDVLPLARRKGSGRQRAEFYMAASNAILLGRRYSFSAKALRYQRQALRAYQRCGGAPVDVAMALFDLAFVLLLGNQSGFEEAAELLSRANVLAEGAKEAVMQARVSTYRAIAFRRMRRVEDCEREALRARDEAQACGLRGYVGAAHGCLAWVALMRDEPEQVTLHVARARQNWWRSERTEETRQSEYPFQWLANLPLLAVQLSDGESAAIGATLGELLHTRQARLSGPLHRRLLRLHGSESLSDVELREIDSCLRLAGQLHYL